jgi:hypothetical protein
MFELLAGILNKIVPVIHCCSEEEALNLGIFLSELFGLLNHWNTRVNWERECDGYSAFAQRAVDKNSIPFDKFSTTVFKSFAK